MLSTTKRGCTGSIVTGINTSSQGSSAAILPTVAITPFCISLSLMPRARARARAQPMLTKAAAAEV